MPEAAARGEPGDDLLARSVEALAVLLDAGISPVSVWAYLAEDAEHPAMRGAAGRVAAGVPPSEALADASRWRRAVRATARSKRGRPVKRERAGLDHGMATVAAAWAVAEHAGAALAPALRGAATALRDRAETARDVRTSLAGPRATARLMAWLPLVGVVMAYAIGVDVVGALAGGPLGWGAAGGGVSLMAAGRAWTARLVREASRAGPVAGAEPELMAIALAGGMSPGRARLLVAETKERIGLRAAEDGGSSVDRVLRIAERAGAPAIELLSAEALQERRVARAKGRTGAELLGVRLLLPLGICVLPAFVLLGVVPVILAMMSSTFTGLV